VLAVYFGVYSKCSDPGARGKATGPIPIANVKRCYGLARCDPQFFTNLLSRDRRDLLKASAVSVDKAANHPLPRVQPTGEIMLDVAGGSIPRPGAWRKITSSPGFDDAKYRLSSLSRKAFRVLE
jgi:hypothetical protein